MLDDATSKTSGTPEWWLLRLGKRLSEDHNRFDRLQAYWRGQPPMPFGNQRMREAYRRLQRMSRTNFGVLIAEAVLERMKLVGFRAGPDSTEDADMEAWGWWQANGLDADSGLVHRAAVVLSRAYVIVGDDPETEGQPLVTVEDPRQVIHESHPTNRRKVIAALKTWWDDVAGAQLAVLYLPDEVHYFRTRAGLNRNVDTEQLWATASWEPDVSDEFPDGIAENTLGEVPVVPFINRPDMSGEGMGEFEDVIDILDRINTEILDRMVISSMQAYRQRWAKGIKMTDEDGNDTSNFDPGADLLWAVEDESAQFGQFDPTDLTPIIKAIESDVQYLSAITRTPPHYILAGIVNASGDALSVAETGLVSKLLERETEFGESWERVYRLAAKTQGRDVGPECEVLWRDPQFRSLTEMASASVQLKAADVPWRTRMRKLDMTPAEIDRMEVERHQDAMVMGFAQPGQPGQQQLGPNALPALGAVPIGPGDNGEVAPAPPPPNAGRLSTPNAGAGNTANQGDTALGTGASWATLYARAKAMGIRGASRMSKAQLRQVVGGGS